MHTEARLLRGTQTRSAAAAAVCLVIAACGSAGGPPGVRPAARESLAGRYLAVARPADHRLDAEVDGFAGHRRDLGPAETDLRAEAVTERWFDRRLGTIPFPRRIAATERALVLENQRRAGLADREARSLSVGELLSFADLHAAADAAVEAEVRIIRRELRLPPPSGS